MKIADFEIGSAPFICAEVGLNHCGSVDKALEMIGVAKKAGCTSVKFQTFKAKEFCDPDQIFTYKSQGVEINERIIEMFRRHELPEGAWADLKAECDRQGIIFLSTPQNRSDLDILLKVGLPAIKVGSDDLTNLSLLRDYAKEGLPIILSTGMSYGDEIIDALNAVTEKNMLAQFIVLVCTSEYPTRAGNCNLGRIHSLRNNSIKYVGFSDHTRGFKAAIAAVGAGAVFFEKHFTLDHNLPGPDHWWSANKTELFNWVAAIKESWMMMGDGKLQPSNEELENKRKYQRKSGQKLRGVQ